MLALCWSSDWHGHCWFHWQINSGCVLRAEFQAPWNEYIYGSLLYCSLNIFDTIQRITGVFVSDCKHNNGNIYSLPCIDIYCCVYGLWRHWWKTWLTSPVTCHFHIWILLPFYSKLTTFLQRSKELQLQWQLVPFRGTISITCCCALRDVKHHPLKYPGR